MINAIIIMVTKKKILADNDWNQQVSFPAHTTCAILMASVMFPDSLCTSDTVEIDFIRKYVLCRYN